MYMPLIASIGVMTKGHITKKNTYMPLAIGSLLGGTGSLAGGTAPLLANEVLEYSGAETFTFFSTLPVALCVIGTVAICFWLFLVLGFVLSHFQNWKFIRFSFISME